MRISMAGKITLKIAAGIKPTTIVQNMNRRCLFVKGSFSIFAFRKSIETPDTKSPINTMLYSNRNGPKADSMVGLSKALVVQP